jgi:prophage regulatory protein
MTHLFKGNIEMDTDQEHIVRIDIVLYRTGLSRSTMYRKMKEGSFPNRVQIGIHSSGWRESDINCWISNPMGFGALSEQA